MAINISAATNQASQLWGYADRLQQAKNQLNSYKSSLSSNWQGNEVPHIMQGIDKAIMQIDAVMRDLRNIANDVNSTAATIKREEDAEAAAARARIAKQRQIAAAQTAYNSAYDELADLTKAKDDMLKKMRNSISLKFKYKEEFEKLEEKIEIAEKKFEECKNALMAARR